MSEMIPTQLTVDTPYMVGPVHCYVARLDGELVLFDTGPPTETGQRFLQQNVDLGRLKHVIITHCHIDHYGQCSWLEQQSDATIYLPYRDILKIKHHEERLEQMYGLLAELGFDDEYIGELGESFNRGVLFPPFPEKYRVAERDIPERLGIETLSCGGHSQSDLVYMSDSWAVTGDTLLRGIYQSPLLDVDIERGSRFCNYSAYCRTIVEMTRLRGKRILPGHRKTIDSVDATICFYILKTIDRALQLKQLTRDYNVAEVVARIFGKTMKDPFHIYLKASEIVFMRDLLEDSGRLRTALLQIGLFDQIEEQFDELIQVAFSPSI